jgi:putative endonuclease
MHVVYMLASRPFGALYVGETSSLSHRLDQHRSGRGSAHTAKYGITTLVWYRVFVSRSDARDFERSLKRWRRAWKEALIAETNPRWQDLGTSIHDH